MEGERSCLWAIKISVEVEKITVFEEESAFLSEFVSVSFLVWLFVFTEYVNEIDLQNIFDFSIFLHILNLNTFLF